MDGDVRLVERARAGDQQAFAELVRRHRELVFCLAVSILGRTHISDAEDLTQEVFLKAHRGLASFQGKSEFSSWIYRITFNQAVNLKAHARFRRPTVDESALYGVMAPDPGPHEVSESSDRNRALSECIHTLPEAYQSALRLYYWLGKGVAEIALLLGVPENTAKSYLHRSRLLLKAMLREKGHSDE